MRSSLISLTFAAFATSGCSALLVGSTTAGLGGAAALSFECPGYVVVTLRDELTGAELCGEPIHARDRTQDRERTLVACAPSTLPPGNWELTAARGGEPGQLVVEQPDHCQRWVYALELTLPAPALVLASGRAQPSASSSASSLAQYRLSRFAGHVWR